MTTDVVLSEQQVSTRKIFRRLLRGGLVRRLSAQHKLPTATHLACIPGDEVGDSIFANGFYEQDFLDAFFHFTSARHQEFSTGVAVDIGANIGNHTAYFAPRFSRVVSFEANPLTFHILSANLMLNDLENVHAYEIALGAENAELEYVQNSGNNLGASGFSDLHKTFPGRRFTLPVRNADAVIEDCLAVEQGQIRLIKIDVGPFSSKVLEGLHGTLSRHKPVLICELIGTATAAADQALLTELGYTHFYALQYKPITAHSRLGRIVQRLANPNIQLVEIKTGQNCRPLYDNVIATVGPIGAPTP